MKIISFLVFLWICVSALTVGVITISNDWSFPRNWILLIYFIKAYNHLKTCNTILKHILMPPCCMVAAEIKMELVSLKDVLLYRHY